MMRVALIDYRAGNLTSVRKALTALGVKFWTPETARELVDASGIIVPGVGHFQATAALDPAWRATIHQHLGLGRPLLGICLGLQWLFDRSTEAPALPGLALLPGTCTLLAGSSPEGRLKVPHVGWNALRFVRKARLLDGVDDGAYVYFTHSYAAPVTDDCVATTTHGETFAAVVERDGVFGVQFHPEKSGDVGLAILRNFLRVAGGL